MFSSVWGFARGEKPEEPKESQEAKADMHVEAKESEPKAETEHLAAPMDMVSAESTVVKADAGKDAEEKKKSE